MNATTVQAIINLVTALLPVIEQGAVTLYDDVKELLATVNASADATPEQLAAADQLAAQSDAAQDAAFAKYEALKASKGL